MSSGYCCGVGSCEKFWNWVVPERKVAQALSSYYVSHPILSRMVAVPVAVITGMIKPLLFPLICLVATLVMPILAGIQKRETGEWMKAWGFSLLGVMGSVVFVALVGYELPLVATAATVVGMMALSIVFHVYQLTKEPKPCP